MVYMMGLAQRRCTNARGESPTYLTPPREQHYIPVRSSVEMWLLRPRPGCVFGPSLLPLLDAVQHLSAAVREGAVADARMGLALCLLLYFRLPRLWPPPTDATHACMHAFHVTATQGPRQHRLCDSNHGVDISSIRSGIPAG